MHEQIHFLPRKKIAHPIGHELHSAITGEQDKRPPVSLLDEVCDPMFQRFLVSGVARVRHFLYDEHFHLFLKIERTPDQQGIDLVRADPLPEIHQIGPADGERRAGHDAGTVVAEDHPA